MAEKITQRQPPRRFLRAFLRAPITLYKARLGFLMGQRFLLLHHVGRKSGLPRQNVLEVVKHDAATDTFVVAVGFGDRSDWYRNLLKTPEASIEVGMRRLEVKARVLSDEEAGEAMVEYAHEHPGTARRLMDVCGYRVDGTDEDYRDVARKGLHFVAFEPRAAAA